MNSSEVRNLVTSCENQQYRLFWKLITGHATFQFTSTWYHFKAYRLLSPSHVTCYSLLDEPMQVFVLLKHDVRGKIFDSNYVEVGVEAVEMD